MIGQLLLWCVAVPVAADEPVVPPPAVEVVLPPAVEVAPPPRLASPPVAVVAIEGGYEIHMNRRTAERLAAALADADEKQIAATLKDLAKQRREDAGEDDEKAAALELAAFLVVSQLPGFKKELDANMGPGGVVVRVTGLQAPTVKFKKPRPRLEKAVEVVRGVMPLLPDDARDVIESLRAVARTTPLNWKVEPR
jgi:hypothetical protein